MASLRLKLNVEEEPQARHYAQFTSSGAFVVGDFFHINEDGYTLRQEGTVAATPATSVVTDAQSGSAEVTSDDSCPGSSPTSAASLADSKRHHTAAPSAYSFTPSSPSLSTVPSPSHSVIGIETASPVSSSTSASAAAGSLVTSLADLVILNPIGQGASGLVQRVYHRSAPGVFLALKVVPLDLSDTKSKQILVELRTLHFAAHPNIVSFYGAFYKERSMSLVLEYMDRGSLSDCLKRIKAQKLKLQKKRRERRIKRWHQRQLQQSADDSSSSSSAPLPVCPLPSPSSSLLSTPLVSESHISCIARQLLSGLHYLHVTRRLIHRDIKTSNILLNSAGQCKLADFGVSGELQDAAGNENKISFVGTVTYMSPERISGLPHSFDSDLWSLGLTLVEMALGYFPYAPQASDAAAADDVSSSEDELDEEVTESDGTLADSDECKNGFSAANGRTALSTTSQLSSPSNSAASTPSNAASFSVASSPMAPRMHKYSKENDLYNATQTHTPGQAMPMFASSPSAAAARPSGTLLHLSTASTSPRLPPRPSSVAEISPANATAARDGPGRKAVAARSRFGFWDIMQRIVQGPAPLLPSRISRKTGREKYSAEFRSFIELCLKKDPKDRSTAMDLLAHPFITQHADVTLLDWIASIPTPPEPAQAPVPIKLAAALTPGGRPFGHDSSPSHGAPLSSPSPVPLRHAPLNSPLHFSHALPPLPHRRHRHHSIDNGAAGGVPGGFSFGTLATQEEESEIETFPVTPSVSGFANAYDSHPIHRDGDEPVQMQLEPQPGGDQHDDAPPTWTTSASLPIGLSVSVDPLTAVPQRLKRKTIGDRLLADDDISESASPVAAAHSDSPSARGRVFDLLGNSSSAPPSVRGDSTMLSSPLHASASPPSGRIGGIAPLKRQKSVDGATPPTYSGLAPLSASATTTSSSSPTSIVHTNQSGVAGSAPVLSASAIFAANLRLVRAQRVEHLQTHQQPTFAQQPTSGVTAMVTEESTVAMGSNAAAVDSASSSPFSFSHGLVAMGGAPLTRIPAVESLLSPFTPASSSRLAHFSLLKEGPTPTNAADANNLMADATKST